MRNLYWSGGVFLAFFFAAVIVDRAYRPDANACPANYDCSQEGVRYKFVDERGRPVSKEAALAYFTEQKRLDDLETAAKRKASGLPPLPKSEPVRIPQTYADFSKDERETIPPHTYKRDTYQREYTPPPKTYSYYGGYYGGREKTVYVRSYYRKDGTYVRSHYRSPPRRRR
jgi:hypothetical protein